jgi:lipopolysaccharide export system permease protein
MTPPLNASVSNLPIKQLDAYLTSQLGLLVGFGLVLFSIIWFAPETLFKLIQALVEGRLGVLDFIKVVGLYLPELLSQAAPIAALLASVFLFRRLSQEFELVAFFTAGISSLRLLLPLSVVGLLLTGFHFFIQEAVLPYTHTPLLNLLYKAKIKEPTTNNFVFFEKQPGPEATLNKLLLAGEASPTELKHVFWLYFHPKAALAALPASAAQSRIHAILQAERATWQPSTQSWLLQNGVEYELDAEGIYRSVHPFTVQHVQGSAAAPKLLAYVGQEAGTLSLSQLGQLMGVLQASGQSQSLPFYKVRWHQKLAQPLSNWVLLLLGAVLGYEPARSRRLLSQGLAALVLFVYMVSIPVCTNLGILGVLAPVLAGWLPLVLAVALTGLYLGFRR